MHSFHRIRYGRWVMEETATNNEAVVAHILRHTNSESSQQHAMVIQKTAPGKYAHGIACSLRAGNGGNERVVLVLVGTTGILGMS